MTIDLQIIRKDITKICQFFGIKEELAKAAVIRRVYKNDILFEVAVELETNGKAYYASTRDQQKKKLYKISGEYAEKRQ